MVHLPLIHLLPLAVCGLIRGGDVMTMNDQSLTLLSVKTCDFNL